ncbi:MAG: hypothetical protein ACYCY8_11455, partial [Burkholderiales bacterium]
MAKLSISDEGALVVCTGILFKHGLDGILKRLKVFVDGWGQVLKCSETTFFTASLSPKDTRISRRQLWVTLKFSSSVARLFLMSEGQNIH